MLIIGFLFHLFFTRTLSVFIHTGAHASQVKQRPRRLLHLLVFLLFNQELFGPSLLQGKRVGGGPQVTFGPQQSSVLEQLGRRWCGVQRKVFLLLLDLSVRHLLTGAEGREGTLSGAGGEGGRNVPLCI